ncbi:short-chain dehydrogenase [Aliidiomarina minuta]|uniref:Short-chain dehydrogenase n=1 Tax=Aliidiomarina minuta TaxID=880057 RepID=A0A432W694_9GAMM|nr:SDR family NAD(P)-dependent oxidoreductase [Aliidiomarina minuta]RUO25598.1 short-chain dehydrogenase [Aliidiomarina minuta]
MKILITGATSGIGAQLVKDYSAEGHEVIACGRSQDKLDTLTQSVTGELSTLRFDVTQDSECESALRGLTGLDVVILNAGVCEYIDDAQHFEAALVKRVFDANFFGVVYCAQALLPQLESGSKLVVVDSMARLLPFTRAQAYGASKAAVHYFAKSMRVDLAPKGIQVLSVTPGFVKTPMTDANDFSMPMRVSVEEASAALRRGVAKGKSSIYFPRLFGWIMRFLNKLPAALQDRISKKMKEKDAQ